jgi:hypothetical protein
MDDDKLVISKTLLKELELSLLEDKKRLDKNLRLLAILLGGLREKPVSMPIQSPTGRKSRCVELAAKRERQSP